MSGSTTYQERRGELEEYFDRTAADAWAKLTSDAPVSGIRATVRAGRDAMREQLLAWLPKDLSGCRVLDAGCGTGALSISAAARGAQVLAIDLSPTLVELAGERTPEDLPGAIEYRTGDMLDAGLGEFDYVVCMDSLIHYQAPDIVAALERLAPRTRSGLAVTFAPKTFALAAMHTVGRVFPRGDRAPAIEPVSEQKLTKLIARSEPMSGWRVASTRRISSGFYTSQAMELCRS